MMKPNKVGIALGTCIILVSVAGCLSDSELVHRLERIETDQSNDTDNQQATLSSSIEEAESGLVQPASTDASINSPAIVSSATVTPAISVAPLVRAERQFERKRTEAATQRRISANKAFNSPPVSVVLQQSGIQADILAPYIGSTDKYQQLSSNRVIRTADLATSTFSIDVDTGAYANVRRFLQSGNLPPADAVRVEELLNYFSYDYAVPDTLDTPFSITTELAITPWNANTHLLHIGLNGYSVANAERTAANLVFLVDVSGSMDSPDKLGLLKSSIAMMAKQLTEQDTVSMVVYAGASGVVLEPTAGDNFNAISRALSRLSAGGSTNGQAGIELAYQLATDNFKTDGVNRVILATDGDFNVGISDIEKLKSLIKHKRQSGIALTTLGFGTGNYNDHLMEQLADVGNGAYAYIDTLSEARKVLVEELTSTLQTIAKDVKIQVEFNPAVVSEYRLIGYVNRHLENEDFVNDKIDAGEIGAGHTVTALYEISLLGSVGQRHSTSRYQTTVPSEGLADEIADVRLRFKHTNSNESVLVNQIVMKSESINADGDTTDAFRFSAAVAAFGQLLRDSNYLEQFDFKDAAELASTARGTDRFGYRNEFVKLVDLAGTLHWQSQTTNESRENESRG